MGLLIEGLFVCEIWGRGLNFGGRERLVIRIYGLSWLIVFCCFFSQLFRGNFDRFSLVEQPVDPPVNGRYVRFNPRSWHGHISMRAEVYGCRAGEGGKTYFCAFQ